MKVGVWVWLVPNPGGRACRVSFRYEGGIIWIPWVIVPRTWIHGTDSGLEWSRTKLKRPCPRLSRIYKKQAWDTVFRFYFNWGQTIRQSARILGALWVLMSQFIIQIKTKRVPSAGGYFPSSGLTQRRLLTLTTLPVLSASLSFLISFIFSSFPSSFLPSPSLVLSPVWKLLVPGFC